MQLSKQLSKPQGKTLGYLRSLSSVGVENLLRVIETTLNYSDELPLLDNASKKLHQTLLKPRAAVSPSLTRVTAMTSSIL